MSTPVTLDSLPPLARNLVEESLAWMAPYGDESCHLLRYPGKVDHYGGLHELKEPPHLIRESAWWATGLLLRNHGDDAARAERILEAVLSWQFNEPGQPYHGTFHRAPEGKLPPKENAEMWKDYDPNWREFIGTTFLAILEKIPDRLSPALREKLLNSIRLAVEGETPERISAAYSNIAMMYAVLLVQAGRLFQKEDWKKQGIELALQVYDLFAKHETFSEYNSPTYYGVILHGLRLWRLESNPSELQEWGAKMEHGLWRHIARFYHPQLRNICGPFDRAYGMDMTKYVPCIGVWMRLALEPERAPAPLFTGEFLHPHDFTLAPVAALLGTEIPADAQARLNDFQGDIEFSQIIETAPELRVATACLKADRMWGAQRGAKTCAWPQFHAVTAHWLQPDGTVGWLRLENSMFVDAVAKTHGVEVLVSNGDTPRAPLTWHISVSQPPVWRENEWRLPGMTVRVKTELTAPKHELCKSGVHLLTYALSPGEEASLHLEFTPA
jgi:hypothetical protein